jgi:hypothetical protein
VFALFRSLSSRREQLGASTPNDAAGVRALVDEGEKLWRQAVADPTNTLNHLVTSSMLKLLHLCGCGVERRMAVVEEVRTLERTARLLWSEELQGRPPHSIAPPPVYWDPCCVAQLMIAAIAAQQSAQQRAHFDALHAECKRRAREAQLHAAKSGPFQSQWVKQREALALDASYKSVLSKLYKQCGDDTALITQRATFSAKQRRHPRALLPVLNRLADKKDVTGAEREVQQFVNDGGVMHLPAWTSLLGVYAKCGEVAGAAHDGGGCAT